MSAVWPELWTDAEILALRPPKHPVRTDRPYAFLVEPEHSAAGTVEDVATVFLTNRECPFRCLMCDLWQNTTDERTPVGSIPTQIEFALERLPPARQIKLYNSGNFFDAQAIPPADHGEIVRLLGGFHTVIVENHPRLCGDSCLRFRDRLDAQLEVAIGLETVHPDVLPRLNKQMTLDDYSRAVEFLLSHDINVRTFILLKPPFLDEEAGVDWALRSVEFASSRGVGCCSLVPTRAGNGAMERLQAEGWFSPPSLTAMERALEGGLRESSSRVFMDLWDVEKFFDCSHCSPERAERLRKINLTQTIPARIECPHCKRELDERSSM